MINVIQHGVKSSELLWRRLSAARARLGLDVIEAMRLDGPPRTFDPGSEIFSTSCGRPDILLVTAGIVGEVRRMEDGRRQILMLRFPGEILFRNSGESAVALTRVSGVDAASFMTRLADGSEESEPLRRAWSALCLADQALLRDQVVRLGRMSAFERTAHLFLELHERLAQVGLATETTFNLPLTQETLSDVIGLSVVHLNRTLQTLRRSDLVSVRHGYVTLLQRQQLASIAGYVSRFPVEWRGSEPPGALRRPALAQDALVMVGSRAR